MLAKVQNTKIDLINAFRAITSSLSASGMAHIARQTTDGLIHRYQQTSLRMGATMEGFIPALSAVEQKDFDCWRINKKKL